MPSSGLADSKTPATPSQFHTGPSAWIAGSCVRMPSSKRLLPTPGVGVAESSALRRAALHGLEYLTWLHSFSVLTKCFRHTGHCRPLTSLRSSRTLPWTLKEWCDQARRSRNTFKQTAHTSLAFLSFRVGRQCRPGSSKLSQ